MLFYAVFCLFPSALISWRWYGSCVDPCRDGFNDVTFVFVGGDGAVDDVTFVFVGGNGAVEFAPGGWFNYGACARRLIS